jgi:gas vesicle protein
MRRSRRTPTLNIANPLSHWVAALEAEQHVIGLIHDIQRSMSLVRHQQEFQILIATESLDPATTLLLSKITGKMATAGTACPGSRIMPATENYANYTTSLEDLIDKNQDALKKAIKQLDHDFNEWKKAIDKSTDKLKKDTEDTLKYLKANPAKSYPSVKVTPASLFSCSYKKITDDGQLRSIDKLYTAVVYAGTDLDNVLSGLSGLFGYLQTNGSKDDLELNELVVLDALELIYAHPYKQYDPFPLDAWTEKKVTVTTPTRDKYTLTSNQFPTGQTLVFKMTEGEDMPYIEITSSLSIELVKGDLTKSKEPLFIEAFTNSDLIHLVEYFQKNYLTIITHYHNVLFAHFKIDTDSKDAGYIYLLGFMFETFNKVFGIYRDIMTETFTFIDAMAETNVALNGYVEKSYISLESATGDKDSESEKTLGTIVRQFDDWFGDFKKKIQHIEKEHSEIKDTLEALSKDGSWLERTFGDKGKFKKMQITPPPLFYSTMGHVDKKGVLPSIQKLGSALTWSCMDLQNFIGGCDELFGETCHNSIKNDKEFESILKEAFGNIEDIIDFNGWESKKNAKLSTGDTIYTSSYYPGGNALSFNVASNGDAEKILNSISLITVKMNPPNKEPISLDDFDIKDLLKIANYMSNHTVDMFRYERALPDIYHGKHTHPYSLKYYVRSLKWMLNVHMTGFDLYCNMQSSTLAFIRSLVTRDA